MLTRTQCTGDGLCAFDLGLNHRIPFDIITTERLVTAARSILLACVLGFAPDGPQGGYQAGIGCTPPALRHSKIADKDFQGDNGKLALAMRSYTPPEIHCQPVIHNPPYSPACTGAIDSMPFSKEVHTFGPVPLPHSVKLPQLYSERGEKYRLFFSGHWLTLSVDTYRCIVSVDIPLSTKGGDTANWLALTQATVAVDAMCARRGLPGTAFNLGNFDHSYPQESLGIVVFIMS